MKISAVWAPIMALATISAAFAQAPGERRDLPSEEVTRGETVLERPRPEYDPLGIRAGGFLLYPAFAVRQEFNSNVFATDRGEISDFITVIQPSIDLRSNWNNHSLAFFANASIGRYWDETAENYEDFAVGGAGRLDITRQTQLFVAAAYRMLHEDRGSPDDVGGREPTEDSQTTASVGLQQAFNRLSFRIDGVFDRFDYRDVRSNAGGTIDNDGRDRNQFLARLRMAYEFAPLREIYLLTSMNWRNYLDRRDSAGFDRDSNGFEIAAGLKYDLTGVTFIDVFLGYSQQDYQDGRLKTARGPSGGLKLTWNVTRLTTVTGSVSRDIEETTRIGSSSYFATKADLRVDHELLRNLIVSGNAGYQQDSFQGTSRDDSYYRAGIGAKYLFDRNFTLEGGYAFRTRDSNGPNADFDESVVFLRLVGRI